MSNETRQHTQSPYLQMPAHQLLDEFGAGQDTPGSGSAAALIGVIACKLLRTVITLTRERETYKNVFSQLHLIDRSVVERIEPFLIKAIQQDSDQFHKVIIERCSRNEATDPKERRKHRDRALATLRKATEITLDTAHHTLELAEHALSVFDLGFRSARGDSGVAVTAALSATLGALCVIYLNFKSFGGGRWELRTRDDADALLTRVRSLQDEWFMRVTRLQEEGVDNPQLEMNL